MRGRRRRAHDDASGDIVCHRCREAHAQGSQRCHDAAGEALVALVEPQEADAPRGRELELDDQRGAVLPGLERYGIRAERAWRARRIEPASESLVTLA